MNLKRKAITQSYLVAIIISILSFFIFFQFFMNMANTSTSKSDDIVCRLFLSTKDNTLTKIAEEFLGNLNQKCKKDEIKFITENKEKTYSQVSKLMQKCWYRYGEGKFDFMSNLNTQGNWCFTCAKLTYIEEGDKYDYKDFINYLKEKKTKINIEGKEVEIPLYDYLNVKYADIDNLNQLYEIESTLNELIKEQDPAINRLAAQTQKEYEYLQDLRLKTIDTSQPLYIVYRYDKPDNDFIDTSTQALIGAISTLTIATAGSMIVSNAIEWATFSAAGGGIGLFCGPLAVICSPVGAAGGAIIGFTKTIFKAGKKSLEIEKKLRKITELKNLISKLKKSSRIIKKTENILSSFSGKIDEIPNLVKELEKVDKNLAKKYSDYYDVLNTIKNSQGTPIKNLDELTEVIIEKENNIEAINKLFDRAVDMMNDGKVKIRMKDVDKLISSQTKQTEDVKELTKILDELVEISNSPSKVENPEKKIEYIKKAFTITTTLLIAGEGGLIGSKLNFYDYQYVDIMTQEEYYRLCGTERMNLN